MAVVTPTQEQIDLVRLYCHNPTQEELPDAIIEIQLMRWLSLYPLPSQEPIAMYNATLDCIRWLIFQDLKQFQAGVKREERVGEVYVKNETTDEWTSPWQWLLDQYENGYLTIPGFNVVNSHVIIGGVVRTEVNRVRNDRESIDGRQHGLWGCCGDRQYSNSFRRTD